MILGPSILVQTCIAHLTLAFGCHQFMARSPVMSDQMMHHTRDYDF